MKKVENFDNKNMFSTIQWLIKMVRYLLGKESSGGGDFMTLNSENLITEDWGIINNRLELSDSSLIFFDEEGYYGQLTSNYFRIGDISGTLDILPNNGEELGTITNSNSEGKYSQLRLPNSGVSTRTIPVSVNGNFADEYGNIEIEGGEQQFVQITEGANTGWGLKYRADNPNYYGDIGNRAIDLGISLSSSSTRGATGISSTVSGGVNNTASGNSSTVSGGALNTSSGVYSTVSGGQQNTASNNHSTVSGGSNNTAAGINSIVSGGVNNTASNQSSTVSGGNSNTASDDYSTVSGGYRNYATGNNSTVSGGRDNTANSFGEWVGGLYSTIPTGQNATSFVVTNRLFNIGNGQSASTRSDAFTILKNGLATLPSVTNALIDAEPTGKAVVTKEWSNANTMINPTLITGYDAGATQTLKNVNGVLTWITD